MTPTITPLRAVVATLLIGLGTSSAAQVETRDTPFRVVRVAGRDIRVDIGVQKARANGLARAMILAPDGAVPATLVRVERVCKDLCDGEECHYEAVLRPSRAAPRAIAALAGRWRVGATAAMKPGPDRPIGSLDEWINAEPVRWEGGTYAWARLDDGVFLKSEDGPDLYAPGIDLAACTTRAVAPFTMLVCHPFAQLLYEGTHGVALSFDEYASASVEPLMRLDLEGKDAFLIHLGLKGEVAVALLIKEAGQWRVRFRTADYALIC